MFLKETPRSCSTLHSAAKSPRNSPHSSLTNLSCARRSTTAADCLAPSAQVGKTFLNQKSCSTIKPPRSKSFSTNQCAVSVCNCPDCATLEDIPKHHLQELEDQLQMLSVELAKQKNENLLLRRDILVAKKVVRTEIGVDKGQDFDSLFRKACGESWKGRQEMIFKLKRKLRNLSEIVERIEDGMKVPTSRKRARRKTEEPVFPDERTLYWCLELERQEVWKNAERNKQAIVACRDAMKKNLEPLIIRNEELMEEAVNLRDELASNAKMSDEGLVERVRELEGKIKTELEEKSEERQSLDDLEQQICRNGKHIGELKLQVSLEKQTLKDTQAKIKSLKALEETLYSVSEEVKMEKCKQSLTIRKRLQEIEQDYKKITTKSERVIELFSEGKQLLMKSESFPWSNVNSKNLRILSQCELKNGKGENQSRNGDGGSDSSTVHTYENKLLRYKSLLESLLHRNHDKMRNMHGIVKHTSDEVFLHLGNRCTLWKLTAEADALRCHWKKLRKVAFIYPSKQKLAKKKDSSQLLEILEERRLCMSIRKIESQFLKQLIKSVFSSKADDCKWLEVGFNRNRDHFLKVSSELEV